MNGFVADHLPREGEWVIVLCEDEYGTYSPSFLCAYRDGTWYSEKLLIPLAARVIGWKLADPARLSER